MKSATRNRYISTLTLSNALLSVLLGDIVWGSVDSSALRISLHTCFFVDAIHFLSESYMLPCFLLNLFFSFLLMFSAEICV